VHLVQNDQAAEMVIEVELGLGQLRAVTLGFEVQVQRPLSLSQGQGQRRLAHLTRACQHDGGDLGEALPQLRGQLSWNHICNSDVAMTELQG
jgi:hypothetical protein